MLFWTANAPDKFTYRLSFEGLDGSDCKLQAEMAWACNGITLECQVQIPRTFNSFLVPGKFNRTVAVVQAIEGLKSLSWQIWMANWGPMLRLSTN